MGRRRLDPKGLYRPVVLWLDDVQWGFDAIRLVRYLLNRVVGDRPIMVILTARDDILQDRPARCSRLSTTSPRGAPGSGSTPHDVVVDPLVVVTLAPAVHSPSQAVRGAPYSGRASPG
jgi:hypothetical protein